jgi:hypothetical protein
MSRELLKVLFAAQLTVLGAAFTTTHAAARDCAPGQSVKRVTVYESLSMQALGADPALGENGGDCPSDSK